MIPCRMTFTVQSEEGAARKLTVTVTSYSGLVEPPEVVIAAANTKPQDGPPPKPTLRLVKG